MCLEIKKGTSLKVAERDIECYKTVVFRNGCLISLWRDFIYSREEKFPIQEKFEEPWFVSGNIDYAYNGFHTFRCMARAKRDLEFTDDIRFLYMRCVIPKGARYYVGTDRDYCSDSLIVTGWKTRNMKRWVSWSPCLYPEFIAPDVTIKVKTGMLKETEVGKEADHVS